MPKRDISVDRLECPRLELVQANPFRPPDWRSLRAELNDRSRSDEWIRRIKRFRQADEDPTADPILHAAHAIHRGNRWMRAALQARILSGSNPALIASRCDLPHQVMTAYEAVFFDVRSRLPRTSWILSAVIRVHPMEFFAWSDVECFWGLMGYRFGAAAMEELLEGAKQDELEKAGLDAYLGASSPVSNELKFRVLVARIQVPASSHGCRLCRQLLDRAWWGLSQTMSGNQTHSSRPDEPTSPPGLWENSVQELRRFIPNLHLTT